MLPDAEIPQSIFDLPDGFALWPVPTAREPQGLEQQLVEPRHQENSEAEPNRKHKTFGDNEALRGSNNGVSGKGRLRSERSG